MTLRYLLDTHVLLWWLSSPERLSKIHSSTLRRCERQGQCVAVSVISLWEIAKLASRGRLSLKKPVDEILSAIEQDPRIEILPLSIPILLESVSLGPDFHRDPGDELIVGTSLHHHLTVLTEDEKIRQSQKATVI